MNLFGLLKSMFLLPSLLQSVKHQKHSPDTAKTFSGEYDYIIVGGGTAGSVVASRLSEIPCVRVLLLEAGKPPPLLTEVPAFGRAFWFTDIDWAYKTTPQKYTGNQLKNRQVIWPSGKTLGGSSVLNAMLYVRGNRQNYDRWAAEGAEGWSYDDVFPYFIKLEDNKDKEYIANGFHGVGGPQTVHRPRYQAEFKDSIFKTIKSFGYEVVDSNAYTQTGFYDLQGTLRKGQRCSTAKAYLVPAENRTNLDILANAMVRKVLIKHRRAVGVVFDYQGATWEVKAKREVIMAAGTTNTAQLLMLSGIGPRHHLEKFEEEMSTTAQLSGLVALRSNPGFLFLVNQWENGTFHPLPGRQIPVIADLPVGLNMQDHPGAPVFYVFNRDIPKVTQKITDPANVAEYIHNRTGPLVATEFCSVLGFLENNAIIPRTDFPDHQLYFIEAQAELALQTGITPEYFFKVVTPYFGRSMYLCISSLLHPYSRGTVTLQSTDPYDPPVIDPNYFEDPRDLHDIVQGMKTCKKIGNSPYMRKLASPFETIVPGCEKFVGNDDLYFACVVRAAVITFSHQVGTARMGHPKDPRTVVDPKLRVLGIKGLRVVDASVMPTIPSANTNVPVMMVAEKASDIIKESIDCLQNHDYHEEENNLFYK